MVMQIVDFFYKEGKSSTNQNSSLKLPKYFCLMIALLCDCQVYLILFHLIIEFLSQRLPSVVVLEKYSVKFFSVNYFLV